MAYMLSTVATVLNAQQAPQLNWFLTGVTARFSLLQKQLLEKSINKWKPLLLTNQCSQEELYFQMRFPSFSEVNFSVSVCFFAEDFLCMVQHFVDGAREAPQTLLV